MKYQASKLENIIKLNKWMTRVCYITGSRSFSTFSEFCLLQVGVYSCVVSTSSWISCCKQHVLVAILFRHNRSRWDSNMCTPTLTNHDRLHYQAGDKYILHSWLIYLTQFPLSSTKCCHCEVWILQIIYMDIFIGWCLWVTEYMHLNCQGVHVNFGSLSNGNPVKKVTFIFVGLKSSGRRCLNDVAMKPRSVNLSWCDPDPNQQ